MDDARPLLELGVLAASLVLAGVAALLNRPRDERPDWPPSPISARYVRRDLVVTGGGVLLLLAGIATGATAVAKALQ